MPIKKNSGRQDLIVASLFIGFADPSPYGTAQNAIDLPGNAVLVGGDVTVITPWNSTTTATLQLGDAAVPARYTSAPVDLKTAGRTALTLTGYKHSVAESLKALLAQTGAAATAGTARVTLQYFVEGRAAFSQG